MKKYKILTKVGALNGVLWAKTTIWAATKGFVGGGQKWGRATMEKMKAKYIYICQQKRNNKLDTIKHNQT